jgi:2-polyprenyl-3-methyl-5-hydroxy-6-metoxy-1,4-benzoquinol methylase
MGIQISRGFKDHGTVTGNVYDKYQSLNPLVRWIMRGFNDSVSHFINAVSPATIYEVGCGEGYWVLQWTKQRFFATGSDFSPYVINIAQQNALKAGISPSIFFVDDIYQITDRTTAPDLVVCSEVLEHLDKPNEALKSLQHIVSNYLMISVPREPLWRLLNLLRGKYVLSRGNTPGHLQHWSKRQFVHLIEQYFRIVEVRCPIPWTVVLCTQK